MQGKTRTYHRGQPLSCSTVSPQYEVTGQTQSHLGPAYDCFTETEATFLIVHVHREESPNTELCHRQPLGELLAGRGQEVDFRVVVTKEGVTQTQFLTSTTLIS